MPKKAKSETMASLLAESKAQPCVWKVGELVEGVLTEKTSRAIYLEIGGKSEGMVIDREMKAARDYIKSLKVGDKVMAVVTQPENDRGHTLLSLKRAASQSLWREFEEKLKNNEALMVRGVQVNRGGLVVEIKGVQGFIPSSQLSAEAAVKTEKFIGQELAVKIIEIDREKNRLIFSEKMVSEAGLLKAQKKALEKIKAGEIFKGEITGMMPFGFFVKITPKKGLALEGLVHISEISWEKVDDLSNFYKQGDKVKVKVLAVDKKTGRLNLSIKQLLPDPWEKIEKEYAQESKVKGEVVKAAPFGVFINLAPGVEGLIHISKIPAEKVIKIGDKVECYVESVNKDQRRMSLGLVLKEKPVGYK
jgi:ribosomal protein S1